MSEVQLGIYDVYFEHWDGIIDYVRVTAEDEYHAEQKVRALCCIPDEHPVREIEYRGEAY